jgi:hypothetical protein
MAQLFQVRRDRPAAPSRRADDGHWHQAVRLPETDLTRIAAYCAGGSPADYADQLRTEHHVRGLSVTLCEARILWQGGAWVCHRFGQLRYRPDVFTWALYWADRNDRWHPYDPDGRHLTGTARELLDEVQRDPTGIFRG